MNDRDRMTILLRKKDDEVVAMEYWDTQDYSQKLYMPRNKKGYGKTAWEAIVDLAQKKIAGLGEPHE